MPERIQLRRTKGWRKPPDAVVVARPTRWGNPFNWKNSPSVVWPMGCEEPVYVTASDRRYNAVRDFENLIRYGGGLNGYPSHDEIRRDLAGRDLCCWCPPGHPCHADVLMEIANEPAVSSPDKENPT
jgi:hypothetical protein